MTSTKSTISELGELTAVSIKRSISILQSPSWTALAQWRKAFGAGLVAAVALFAFGGSPVAANGADIKDDELIIENTRAVYFPSERVDLQYSQCAPRTTTRLELRSARTDGLVLAVYPSPQVNVAGSVRASVILPDAIRRGEAFLILSCATAAGPLVQASASLLIDLPTAAVASSREVIYLPVLLPNQPEAATEDLAVTGLSVLPIAVGVMFAVVLAGGVLVITRRRGGPQWSPSGMPMNGPR
jgi:hypothetical protein